MFGVISYLIARVRPTIMKPRRRARCLTLEVLYECDIAERDALVVLNRRTHDDALGQSLAIDPDDAEAEAQYEPLTPTTIEFAGKLLAGVRDNQTNLDMLITRYAPEWPLEQIAVIDRNILRVAIFEILVEQTTPIKVSINEAVELAKSYGSDSAARFVNGVLGTLTEKTDELRAEIVGELVAG